LLLHVLRVDVADASRAIPDARTPAWRLECKLKLSMVKSLGRVLVAAVLQ